MLGPGTMMTPEMMRFRNQAPHTLRRARAAVPCGCGTQEILGNRAKARHMPPWRGPMKATAGPAVAAG